MPKKLEPVTRQDAIELAFADIMPTLYSAVGTQLIVIPCIKESEGTDHICYFNLMLERGWVEKFEDEVPEEYEEVREDLYTLTILGSDQFCYQHLAHSYEKGPVFELIDNWFNRDRESLLVYKDAVRRERINRAL
jgi:hypothetical protein